MELAGAVLPVKLVNFVKKNSVIFWTDSVEVLHDIKEAPTCWLLEKYQRLGKSLPDMDDHFLNKKNRSEQNLHSSNKSVVSQQNQKFKNCWGFPLAAWILIEGLQMMLHVEQVEQT